jgi:hypothetical protein
MTRLAFSEQELLRLLRLHPTRQISYDDLAAQCCGNLDRRTLITAMKRLERKYLVVIVRSRGPVPNRYLLTEQVITTTYTN